MALRFDDLKLAHVECSLEDGVGWIRMNRPPVNAIDLDFLVELTQAIQAARNDPEVKVAMLASLQRGYFSAGLDLKELELSSDEGRAERLDQMFKDGVLRVRSSSRSSAATASAAGWNSRSPPISASAARASGKQGFPKCDWAACRGAAASRR